MLHPPGTPALYPLVPRAQSLRYFGPLSCSPSCCIPQVLQILIVFLYVLQTPCTPASHPLSLRAPAPRNSSPLYFIPRAPAPYPLFLRAPTPRNSSPLSFIPRAPAPYPLFHACTTVLYGVIMYFKQLKLNINLSVTGTRGEKVLYHPTLQYCMYTYTANINIHSSNKG